MRPPQHPGLSQLPDRINRRCIITAIDRRGHDHHSDYMKGPQHVPELGRGCNRRCVAPVGRQSELARLANDMDVRVGPCRDIEPLCAAR